MLRATRHPAPLLAGLLALCLSLATSPGQIGVGGIADKKTYNDVATFTVTNLPGYSYEARLDGALVGIGAPMAVRQVDYHELTVWCTNSSSGIVTNQRFRFIVANSARGGTENGLPSWVPYPMIPSTPEEAAGAQVRLLGPAVYPTGLELPVAAWIEDPAGASVRVNGKLSAAGYPPITIRRGVGSCFLAPSNAPGTLVYAPQGLGLGASLTVQIETNTLWQPVSGTLTGENSWPEDARIALTGNLVLAAGATLNVGAGTVVRIGAGNSLVLAGRLVLNGRADRPIVLAPASRSQPWGGFYLTNSTSQLQAEYTIFTGSGANANAVPDSHRHEQCLLYCDNHAQFSLTNCAILSLAGQLGHAVDRGQPWIRAAFVRTLIQRCTTGGEWNGAALQFLQSALIEVPYETTTFADSDEDGLYFTTGQYEVRDSLIGWTRDDGIDSGSGGAGSVTVSNTWLESTFHEAFAWSGGNRLTTNLHTVCINCGQGFECGYSTTANSPLDVVADCLSLGNLVGARFGDNYDWTYNGLLRVTNSLLLNNYRDLWGCNWQDWTYRVAAMDIQSNLLSQANPYHPNNDLWQPATDGWRLARFMTTPPDAPVGIGFATAAGQFPASAATNPLPVRLSSFTTHTVQVDYAWEAPGGTLSAGTVAFAPGETVKFIPSAPAQALTQPLLHLRLANPLQAHITGQAEVWFTASQDATLKLHAVLFQGNWLLVWNDPAAQLEAADELDGHWRPVPSASPAPVDPGAPQRFYRLRKP